MITGESGTGKELVARLIHERSSRRDKPFIAVSCAAIPPTLIEAELFGHERGAFTGAVRRRVGRFKAADSGTLFLDEIGEMPLELQAKLLRVLETGTLLKVGGSKSVPVDVRVIAATNRDPARAVREKALREDLYYRLNVFPIPLPSLGARGDDLWLLADFFLDAVNAREETQKTWSQEARGALRAYRWPGNVRELKNAVERAAILADSVIGPDLLPRASAAGEAVIVGPGGEGPILPVRIGSSLDEVERQVILATLEQLKGDKKLAAQVLGISLKTLYSRLSVCNAATQAHRNEELSA
jgi:DNA-binding NtrC family response regulator